MNDAIRGLLVLLGYVVAVVALSGACIMLVNYLCPQTDDHKQHKITNVTENRKNYI